MNQKCIGGDNLNTRTGSLVMIFFLTMSIFTSMFVALPNNTIVVADTSVWENEYGRLEVEPATSTNLIRQKQFYNLTWYYPDNTIDIAFGFNESLSYGQIYYYNDGSYNKVSTGHIEYGGQHYYTISNINVDQDETKHGYWEYDTLPMSSGKWDMYAKLSSDSWATAFSTGRIIHLDPWWDSDWSYRKTLTIDNTQVPNTLKNYPVLVYIEQDTDMFGSVQNDLDDIVFVSTDNNTVYSHEIDNYTIGANFITAFIWVNITHVAGVDNGTDTQFYMFYGNAGCSNQEDASGVWDSNYTAVYHMNSTTDTCLNDSTNNDNHAIIAANTSGLTHFGETMNFGANADNISFPDGTWLVNDSTEYGTFESWTKANATDTYYQMLQQRDDGTGGLDQAYYRYTIQGGHRYAGHSDGDEQWYTDTFGASSTDWEYHALAMKENDVAFYTNGNITRSDTSCFMPNASVGDKLYNGFGTDHAGDHDFNGSADEIRISNIRRNDSWIVTTYNSMVNLSTFVTFGAETEESTAIDKISGFTATTDSNSQITLGWTNSITGNYTYIERHTQSNWVRGEGTFVYNSTGSGKVVTGLTSGVMYYFGAWAFNESRHLFSDITTCLNHTGPTNPSVTSTTLTGSTINITWSLGSRADKTALLRKADGYPTDIDDGTELYNGSATGFDDTSFTTTSYYKLFSWNDTNGLSSSGTEVNWGKLDIRVYDENTSEVIYNYTVFITNASGTETYETYSDGNQLTSIDLSLLPTGENVAVKINASVYTGNYSASCTGWDCLNMTNTTIEYEDRIYYMDIYPNTYYNLTAYLLNASDALLYRLTVYGPIGQYGANPPVEGAVVDIKRYINSSVGYKSIGIYVTDGDGNVYVYLYPGELYKITITHDDYLTSVSDFIPSDSVFVQPFRLVPVTSDDTTLTYDDFWEDITIDIDMVDAGCWQLGNITIVYADSNSSTINTQIRLFEIYGTTTTFLNSWDNSSNSFNIVNGSINTSRMHYVDFYINDSATYYITQPITILIPNVNTPMCGRITPFDLDDRITDIIGPFTIGDQVIPWTTIIGTIIPILVLVSFGPFNTGLGIIGCGVSMAMLQGFLDSFVSGGFQWGIVGIGAFIVVIGILYIMTKGSGGDQL